MAQPQSNWIQYVNTILLGLLMFFVREKNDVLLRHDTEIADHQTRISVLEDRKSRTATNIMQPFEGILPDRIEVKED
jgi:hypothetical protein